MLQETITIINKRGLHARAATKLAKAACQFQSDIKIKFNGNEADCKSVMSILLLAAAVDSIIELSAHGCDEQEAVQDLKQLIASKFDENE